ncbi:hypothetical protein PAXRUDRAFT_823137 [Paxillus rubicundulus Ve08.2h10]|uniref:Uncharacterized protein n=1 Tax=Paxillus rubicundulus Ve08.2h10 TaxID=930991 RepID=A0A0D0E938_9AGAM|nr:hypothetical protein PAXRUDRAFT_823137 [Paxillus rubicundulus Ve08.2h10]
MSFRIAEPSSSLGGRQLAVNRGKCVEGGSNVNLMMYTRASGSFILYQRKRLNARVLVPLKVSYDSQFTEVGVQALDVAAKYNPGRKIADDSNDLSTCDVYSGWKK